MKDEIPCPADHDKPQTAVSESDPRVQLATERTLLAWVRTGLALMAFGFVVARFALILQSLGVKTNSFFTIKATVIGLLMVILGVIANLGASLHYRSYFKRIRRSGKAPFAAWSLAVRIAFASAIVGLILAVYLLFVDVANWNLHERLKDGMRSQSAVPVGIFSR